MRALATEEGGQNERPRAEITFFKSTVKTYVKVSSDLTRIATSERIVANGRRRPPTFCRSFRALPRKSFKWPQSGTRPKSSETCETSEASRQNIEL